MQCKETLVGDLMNKLKISYTFSPIAGVLKIPNQCLDLTCLLMFFGVFWKRTSKVLSQDPSLADLRQRISPLSLVRLTMSFCTFVLYNSYFARQWFIRKLLQFFTSHLQFQKILTLHLSLCYKKTNKNFSFAVPLQCGDWRKCNLIWRLPFEIMR